MDQLHALVDEGAGADRVADPDPSGGDAGRRVVASGTPEEVAAEPASGRRTWRSGWGGEPLANVGG